MNTDFKKQYMDWLSANIYQNKITDSIYSVTFPYLDHNNDHIYAGSMITFYHF